MKNKIVVTFFLLQVAVLPTRAQDSQSAKAKPSPKAQWSPELEAGFGLTAEEFRKAGLYKLSPDELLALMVTWYQDVRDREQKASDKAKAEVFAYNCPVPGADDKIKVYLDEGENNPSEFTSHFHQHLRSLADVEIVYSEKEAHLYVSVLAFETRVKSASYANGYAVSVVTGDPCEGRFSDSKPWTMNVLDRTYMYTDSSVDSLADSVVSDLDSRDIENLRKLRAAAKKAAEPVKESHPN
jgi:hypothetical protein